MIPIINARHIALRDNQSSVREWIRVTSVQLKIRGRLHVLYDGTTNGKPVYAFLSNGRWLAVCDEPNCNGCEYVDAVEKLFFCMTCSNGNSGHARPVIFPRDVEGVEAALLERDMIPVGGGDEIVQAFNARPADPALRRDWAPKELEGRPELFRRVIVDSFGETPAIMRRKTEEVKRARDV